jgi:hypothetical protein
VVPTVDGFGAELQVDYFSRLDVLEERQAPIVPDRPLIVFGGEEP